MIHTTLWPAMAASHQPSVAINVGSHESDLADVAGPLSPVFRSSSSAVRDTARQARDKRRKELLLDDEVR